MLCIELLLLDCQSRKEAPNLLYRISDILGMTRFPRLLPPQLKLFVNYILKMICWQEKSPPILKFLLFFINIPESAVLLQLDRNRWLLWVLAGFSLS